MNIKDLNDNFQNIKDEMVTIKGILYKLSENQFVISQLQEKSMRLDSDLKSLRTETAKTTQSVLDLEYIRAESRLCGLELEAKCLSIAVCGAIVLGFMCAIIKYYMEV